MKNQKRLIHKIKDFFSIKVMIVFIVIMILFVVFVLPAASAYSEHKGGTTRSPDTSFFYTADDLYNMADAYGNQGRNAYLLMRFTFDLAWPIVYLFFMLAVLVNLLRGFDEKLCNLLYVPVIGTLFDYLENIFAAITIGRFPKKTPIIADLTPIFTMIKWVMLGLAFILMVIFLIIKIIKLFKKKKQLA